MSQKTCGTSNVAHIVPIQKIFKMTPRMEREQASSNYQKPSICETLTFNAHHIGLTISDTRIHIYYTPKALQDFTRDEKDLIKEAIARWNQFYKNIYKTDHTLFAVHEEVKNGNQYVILNSEWQHPEHLNRAGDAKWAYTNSYQMESSKINIYLKHHREYPILLGPEYGEIIRRQNFLDTVMHELGHVLGLKHRTASSLMNTDAFYNLLTGSQRLAEMLRHNVRVHMARRRIGGFGDIGPIVVNVPVSISTDPQPLMGVAEFEKFFNSIVTGLTAADRRVLHCVIPAYLRKHRPTR